MPPQGAGGAAADRCRRVHSSEIWRHPRPAAARLSSSSPVAPDWNSAQGASASPPKLPPLLWPPLPALAKAPQSPWGCCGCAAGPAAALAAGAASRLMRSNCFTTGRGCEGPAAFGTVAGCAHRLLDQAGSRTDPCEPGCLVPGQKACWDMQEPLMAYVMCLSRSGLLSPSRGRQICIDHLLVNDRQGINGTMHLRFVTGM